MSILNDGRIKWLKAELAKELHLYDIIKDDSLMEQSTRENIKQIEDRLQELEIKKAMTAIEIKIPKQRQSIKDVLDRLFMDLL